MGPAIDFGWPDVGAGVEFDGDIKYGGGELGDPGVVRRQEERRHDDVVEAGVDLLRIGWPNLGDTEQLGYDIRAVYDSARRRTRTVRRRA